MTLLKHYIKLSFYYIPILSWVLSGKNVSGTLKSLSKLYWFVITRKTILRQKPMNFLFMAYDKTFSLDLIKITDIVVLSEVFVLNEYEWEVSDKVENILDLGAHWGDSSIFYAAKYPEAKVFAIEPTTKSFERLVNTTKEFDNIFPIKASISNENGLQKIFTSENSLGNSIVKREDGYIEEEVTCLTLDGFLNETKVQKFDIVKFDIEGAEKFIFEDPEAIKASRSFIGEIHLDLMNVSLDSILDYFSTFEVEMNRINDSRYIVKAQEKYGT